MDVQLARTNALGFDEELLFEALNGDSKPLSKKELTERLYSKAAQEAAIAAAVKYSSNQLNNSDTRVYINETKDLGLCVYSWISWLPFSGCTPPESNDLPGANTLNVLYDEPVCYKF